MKHSVKDDIFTIYTIPHTGLTIEESSNGDTIKAVTKDKAHWDVWKREGQVHAVWAIKKTLQIDAKALSFINEKTFGSNSFQRSCSKCLGVNYYKGITQAPYVRPTPRKSKESVLKSSLHHKSFNMTFLPLMNKIMDVLYEGILDFGVACDTVYDELIHSSLQFECNTWSPTGETKLESPTGELKFKQLEQDLTSKQSRFNSLQIFTGPNGIVRGFCNGVHEDIFDSHGKSFDGVAEHILLQWIAIIYTNPNISSESVLKINHLWKKIQQGSFSLSTICGYHTRYTGIKNVCAVFLYFDIKTCVSIPMNLNSNHNFDSSKKHQTAFPFTYDDKYVYLDDKELEIWAWGGSKSNNARKYLENELHYTDLPRCTEDAVIDEIVRREDSREADRIIDHLGRENFLSQRTIDEYFRAGPRARTTYVMT